MVKVILRRQAIFLTKFRKQILNNECVSIDDIHEEILEDIHLGSSELYIVQ